MADDWEADDWEADNFKPVLPATTAAGKGGDFETKGQALLSGAGEPDMSKFADEDQGDEDEPKYNVPASQPKKKVDNKFKKGEVDYDTPLDDPVAEKLRQQKLVELADIRAARELFGGGEGGSNALDNELPKTLKEFEDYAYKVVARYVLVHKDSKNFKGFIKALVKEAVGPLTAQEAKDVETALAGVRSDKTKAEAAAAAEKKGVKKNVNVGKGGGAAGLDDYIYDDVGDDFDFM